MQDVERRTGEQPHCDPAAEAADCGQERDAAPPAVREEIDDRDEVRDEQREQEDLDRPAAYEALTRPHERCRSLGQLEPLVERTDELLRRTADLPDARGRERAASIGERLGWTRPRRRDREGGDPSGNERSLAVQREREPEVDQLRDDARPPRRPARLLRDPPRGRLDEARRGRARRVACDLDPRFAEPADRVEVDRRDDREWRVRGEAQRAEPTERAGIGREEDDRVSRAHARAGRRRERIAARELDERCGAGGVVVRTRAVAGVVTVSHHDDRLARLSARDGPEVLQARRPRPGIVAVHVSDETGRSYCRIWSRNHARREQRTGTSGRPVGVVAGEICRERPRRRPVEVGRQLRRRQRHRPHDRECEEEDRERHDERTSRGRGGCSPDVQSIRAGRGDVRAPSPGLSWHRRNADARPLPHDPAGRRRGRRAHRLDVPARERRVRCCPGWRRRGGAPAVCRATYRPGRARPDAAAAGWARGLQAAAGDEHGADHHAHGARRRARQGARARARRGRLHHEAVLDPRVPFARPRAAPPRAPTACAGGRGRRRGSKPTGS